MTLAYIKSAHFVAYLDRFRDSLDKGLFFFFFIVGAAAIWILKFLDYPQWVITGTPIFLMFAYAVYAYRSPGFRLREDRAADHLYYLGFLYTLTSLAYSLYLFRSDQTGTDSIIANFGIALLTTIVGLALRVLFSQLREDPLEYEREARHSLSEAVRELKTELDESILSFNSFRRSLQQSLQEGMDNMLAGSSKLLDEHGSKFADVTDRFVSTFDQANTLFTQASTSANKNLTATAVALDELVMRINSIEAPKDLVKRKIEPAVETITQLVDQIMIHSQSEISYFDRLHALLTQVHSSHQSLEKTLNELVQVYREQALVQQQDTHQIRQVVSSLHQLAIDVSADIQQKANLQTQQLEKFIVATNDLSTQYQKTLHSDLQMMRERFNLLVQEGEQRRENLDRELVQLQAVTGTLAETHAPLKAFSQQATIQAETLEKITRHYQKTAIEMNEYSMTLSHTLETARHTSEALTQVGDTHTEAFHASLDRLEKTIVDMTKSLRKEIYDHVCYLQEIQDSIVQNQSRPTRRWWLPWRSERAHTEN